MVVLVTTLGTDAKANVEATEATLNYLKSLGERVSKVVLVVTPQTPYPEELKELLKAYLGEEGVNRNLSMLTIQDPNDLKEIIEKAKNFFKNIEGKIYLEVTKGTKAMSSGLAIVFNELAKKGREVIMLYAGGYRRDKVGKVKDYQDIEIFSINLPIEV